MNRWFNWFSVSEKRTAPPVRSEGEILIQGNEVRYSPRKGFRHTVIDLTQLQYVYLYMTEDCQNLVLNDYHQHFISCSTNGFELFFQELSNRILLDQEKFFQALGSRKPMKLELWRATNPNNCVILDSADQAGELRSALSEGFWVNTTPRQRISWDMTSEALAKLPFVYQSTNEYGLTEVRFSHAVQLGNLLLDDFRYYVPTNGRLDVPLDSFYTNLRTAGNGDQNYFLIKKAIQEMITADTDSYERDDQNSCQWSLNGIKFSLIYWYDSRSSYESGYAYLAVKNERTYPDYLIDQACELNGKITKFLLLEQSFRIGSDFRRSHYFRQTPEAVKNKLADSGGKFIIWVDGSNHKVGFANNEYAMIFPLEILTGFTIQNVLPGRSGGGSYLSALLADGRTECIAIGDCHAFDSYVKNISDLAQKPVTELTPYEE